MMFTFLIKLLFKTCQVLFPIHFITKMIKQYFNMKILHRVKYNCSIEVWCNDDKKKLKFKI